MVNALEDVVKLGMFFYPAQKHYGNLSPVHCDGCQAGETLLLVLVMEN